MGGTGYGISCISSIRRRFIRRLAVHRARIARRLGNAVPSRGLIGASSCLLLRLIRARPKNLTPANPPARPAGYSGTPLVQKLGLKSGARMQLVAAPSDFGETMGRMPDGLKPLTRGTLDFAMLFVRTASDLKKGFPRLRDRLESNGMLWWRGQRASVGSRFVGRRRPVVRIEAASSMSGLRRDQPGPAQVRPGPRSVTRETPAEAISFLSMISSETARVRVKAVDALLSGLVDYAGLFPPASQGMREALENYASYRKGEDRSALGRFIVPVSRLKELETVGRDLLPVAPKAEPCVLSVLFPRRSRGRGIFSPSQPHLAVSPTARDDDAAEFRPDCRRSRTNCRIWHLSPLF